MGSFKHAISEATGDFIGFLDADDLWAPDFMQTHIAAHLNRSHSAGMSCSDMAIIGKDRQLLAGTFMTLLKPRGQPNKKLLEIQAVWDSGQMGTDIELPKVYLFKQSFPAVWRFSPTSACVFRRDLLTLIAPRNEDHVATYRLSADYFFNLLSSTLTGCLIIDRPCAYYRMHGGNGFSNNPFVGGAQSLSGKWNAGNNKTCNDIIVQSIVEGYDRLAPVFGLLLIVALFKFSAFGAALKLAWKNRKNF
jgi:glycosyltransferase involved in cell wall biosynthesis